MRLFELLHKRTDRKVASEGTLANFANVDQTAYDSLPGGGDPDAADIGGDQRGIINIQVQLRKSANLSGNYDVEFTNGEKQKVDRNTANAALSKLDNLRTTHEKFNAIKYIGQSYSNLLNFVSQ